MSALAELAPELAPAEIAPPTGSRPGAPRVHLVAACGGARLTAMLDSAGIATVQYPDQDTVTVAVTPGVAEAVRAGAAAGRRLVAVCDTVTPDGLRSAIRAGAAAVLRSADLTGPQLAAAVHGAHHGDGRMPYGALAQLLVAGQAGAGPGAAPGAPSTPALTARQTAVLGLMAEGDGNAVIARTLSCSEHTVKNVIYELMARLQARNRAHAVAHAVRFGLI